ncbi:MAG: transposase [Gammaproteobacteria bacterium]|nr:transposase [Gammaproteobacteria bacterium]
MTIARRHQINLEATPYYHCTSRCVRRAYLCGEDSHTGQSYSHRRKWVESWLLKLNEAFCIELVGYAVMSNHYHVILRVDSEEGMQLSDDQVIDRWSLIYQPGGLMRHYRQGGEITGEEYQVINETLNRWRETLMSISRFMGYLNERIAREANREDQCRGRFWEGRFHSQALLDEASLLQCMVYVDLNPIRSGIASTPDSSEHTSVKHRIDKRKRHEGDQLMGFPDDVTGERDNHGEGSLPLTFTDYLTLLDWSGRLVREDRRGYIAPSCGDILLRLGLTEAHWSDALHRQGVWTSRALGSGEKLKSYSQLLGQQWICQRRKSTALPPPS